MADIRLNFNTYSEAARAYDRLRAENINARIVRTPASLNRSCGYSVKVNAADSQTAGRIIQGQNTRQPQQNPSLYPPRGIFY